MFSWRAHLERFVFDDRFVSQWCSVDHEYPVVKRAQADRVQQLIALTLAERDRRVESDVATAGHSWDPAQRPGQTRLRGRPALLQQQLIGQNIHREVAFFAALAGGRLHEVVIRPVGRQ